MINTCSPIYAIDENVAALVTAIMRQIVCTNQGASILFMVILLHDSVIMMFDRDV